MRSALAAQVTTPSGTSYARGADVDRHAEAANSTATTAHASADRAVVVCNLASQNSYAPFTSGVILSGGDDGRVNS
ncbi:hypothetical protein SNL152K_10376 [Streptomyces sp. NL15-2K]|nr:hypothetical protein SNL152K_10376 [Streptomyces sp. NL15-2K]